jgi:DNA polymerase-3 subunit gamma/tau
MLGISPDAGAPWPAPLNSDRTADVSAEPTLLPLDQPAAPMPYTGERRSLYRAYRSLTFAEVSGQQHVTQTLRNAVRYGSVAHAYLFTGPRGTGKTSTARILARAVNCLQPRDGEPCNACAICLSMLERRSLDLVEIDGASNNSVDDVRELRERVNFRPAEARRKVFIIDEVHMLSIGAFNALLKTLEEPPEHILFLLATTELHKVPATVSSRCQLFALRPIPPPEVVERLRWVCDQEGIGADDEVLRFITAQSTGSLRDALSLLEQIRAYCGNSLVLSDVEAALGVARVGQVASLADAMAGGDLGGALLAVGDLAESGVDPRQLARQLAGYWRDALLARARKTPVAEPRVASCSADAIAMVLRHLLSVESVTRRSDSPRWALELAIAEATMAIGGTELIAATRPPDHAARDRFEASAPPPPDPPSPSAPSPQVPGDAHPPPSMSQPPVSSSHAEEGDLARTADSHEAQATQGGTATPPESAPATAAELTAEQLRERWPLVMRWLNEQQKRSIYSMLQKASSAAITVDDGVITIGFPPNQSWMMSQLDKPNNRQVVEQAVAAVFGGQWGVRCATIEGMPATSSGDRQDDQEYVDFIAATVEARERRR